MALRADEVPVEEEARRIALARAGDASAREALYRAHVAELSRRARFLVHGSAEAEDLVQESFATWLHRIALNLARHQWRAGARRQAFLRAFAWLARDRETDRPAMEGAAE